MPKVMTREDMDIVRDQFVRAAEYAEQAGFDMLELHCAHGYLLSAFITPVTNHRTDEYGGSLENRLRFPMEVFEAVRTVWPEQNPCRCACRRRTGSTMRGLPERCGRHRIRV